MLCQLSLNLIDLPLAHPKLIDWDQPSVIHVDEFSTKHGLLKFMGVEMPHKRPPPPLAYVYKLDPAGYFEEEEISSHKKEILKETKKKNNKRKKSHGENSSRVPLGDSKNETKIKDVSNSENLLEAPEDGDFILPPQEHQPPISSILTKETRPINISLTEIPHITYIAASLPPEQAELLLEFLRNNMGHFAWSYQDMPGLDPKLVVHHLAVDLGAKPIK